MADWVVHKAAFVFPMPRLEVPMPREGGVVAVQVQHGLPVLWYRRPVEDRDMVKRRFVIVGTGHHIDQSARYIGTFQMEDGDFIGHVFEEGTP